MNGADVIIIGGGMAGLELAVELTRRSSASVMVLEAGPDGGRLHMRQAFDEEYARHLWLSPDSDPHFWRPYETDGPHYLGLSGLRRRLGGRSLYWGGVLLPIEDWALDGTWPTPVAEDLVATWRGGPSLYSCVAANIESWLGGAATTPPGPLVMGGACFVPTRHAARAVGGGWAAYSPIDKITPESARPVIVTNCKTLGVLTSSGRVTGVRVRRADGDAEIGAAHVVLAAGTMENSRLAIQVLSEVGGLDDFRLTGLVDKISHGFTFSCVSEKVSPELRAAAIIGKTFHRLLPSARSNHFVRLWVRPDGAIAFDTWLMGEQARTGASEIHCPPASEWPWPTRIKARLGIQDRNLCAMQRDILTRFWHDIRDLFGMPRAAIEFDRTFGSVDLQARLQTPYAAELHPAPVTYSFPLGSEQHEAGTMALGELLNDAQEFRAVSGLSATGPSSFPRTGAANPAMTIFALSLRLAAKLADC